MLKLLTRRFFPAFVLFFLFLFAASSALGAHHSRHATARATHRHARHHHRAGQRAHHKHAAVHKAKSLQATATFTTVLLGDAAVESLRDSLSAGQAEAFPFPAGTSGATGVAHVYIDSKDKASTLIVGLYTNLNNHPGSLLSSGSASSLKVGAWNTVSVTSTQLSAGTTYWLAVLGEGGTLRYRDRKSGPCPSETSAQTTLSTMPASWKTGTLYVDCPVSGYITASESVFSSPTSIEPVVSAPTDTTPPTIGGVATMGGTLSASAGTWSGGPTSYAYQWQDCDSSGAGCSNVSGATSASYVLGAGDVGHTVRVVVTASNAGGSTSATSAATAVVVAPPPTASFSFSPAAPLAGQQVTFDGSGSTCPDGPCAYAWSDDGGTTQPIPALWPLGGGLTLLYTFSGAGTKYVRLVVTDATGQTATVEHNVVVAESSEPPPPTAPVNTAMPVINGTASEGDTLSASTGDWSGSPTSYAYQWQDCDTSGGSCSNVSSATSSSYTLGSNNVGHTIRVVVTASNAGGSTPATSTATTVVSAVESTGMLVGSSTVQTNGDTSSAGSAEAFQYTAPASGTVHSLSLYVNSGSSAPAIVVGLYSDVSGNPGTLLASATISSPAVGAWNPVGVSPVAVSSGSVYWLAALAPSGTLAIRDMANGGGGPTQNSASGSLKGLPSSWSSGASWANSPASFYASGEAVAPPPAPTNTVLPSVGGSAVEGQTLSASNGTWTGSPTSYAYQWEDCNSSGASCANVSGATGSSYRLLAGDIGHTVRVVVTASNRGGSTPASSAATATVAAAPPPAAPVNTALPTVSGSAAEGVTLSVSNGSWTESPTLFAYQWEDCNTAGEGCSTIGGATASTRVLASSDVGHTLRVVVRATNSGGMGEAVSPATSLVTVKETKAGNLEPNLTATGCFENPEEIKEGTEGRIEACNYPGPNNTGPGGEGTAKCSSFAASGSITISKEGEKVENLNITGTVSIDAANVTLNNVCITDNGGDGGGSTVVPVSGSNFTISNSVIRGKNTTTESVQFAMDYEAEAGVPAEKRVSTATATALSDYIYNCSDCLNGNWTVTKSFVFSNGQADHATGSEEAHFEPIYYDGGLVKVENSTLFNPEWQTTIVLGDTQFHEQYQAGPCYDKLIFTKSLVAGAGYLFYKCGNSEGTGSATITQNRFARCTESAEQEDEYHHLCQGLAVGIPDKTGYFPNGGSYGVMGNGPIWTGPAWKWSDNFWDNNLETAES
jgi:PKD domain